MKLGIFGGTFDPIHYGHMMIADQCLQELQLDKLWVIPAADPPHRTVGTSYEDRLMMCRDAFSWPEYDVHGVEVSNIEGQILQETGSPSYTWQTLEYIRANWREYNDWYSSIWDKSGGDAEEAEALASPLELTLIVGADEYNALPSWKETLRLVKLANIACVLRPEQFSTGYRRPKMVGERASFLHVDGAEGFSSTMIRNRVKEGRSINFMVPKLVRDYIEDHGLYRSH